MRMNSEPGRTGDGGKKRDGKKERGRKKEEGRRKRKEEEKQEKQLTEMLPDTCDLCVKGTNSKCAIDGLLW